LYRDSTVQYVNALDERLQRHPFHTTGSLHHQFGAVIGSQYYLAALDWKLPDFVASQALRS